MEENKTNNEQQAGGGRKRRHRNRHRGNGNGNQNQNRQQGQPQANTQPQNGQQNKPQNGQNNNKPQGGQNNKPQEKKQGQQGQQGNQPRQKQPQNPPKNQQNNRGNGQNNKPNEKKEDRKDTYLYTIDGNLYVNLTNKCSNACDFCVRNERTSYYGNYLWLRHGDPTAEKVIGVANGYGDLTRFKEVVFCGFGEPTYKVAEMVALCDYFHSKGLKTRLNTNGQGNLINKRDIVPELKGKIDFVNISLNASCYEKYQPICRSQFKEAGFAGMIEFAKACKKQGVSCRFSIVDCIGEEEVEACKKLAQSVNVPLYIRDYITDS